MLELRAREEEVDNIVAEDEAANTRKRVRRTVAAKAAEGRPHGKETYAYRRTYSPATGALVGVEVEPTEAAGTSTPAARRGNPCSIRWWLVGVGATSGRE